MEATVPQCPEPLLSQSPELPPPIPPEPPPSPPPLPPREVATESHELLSTSLPTLPPAPPPPPPPCLPPHHKEPLHCSDIGLSPADPDSAEVVLSDLSDLLPPSLRKAFAKRAKEILADDIEGPINRTPFPNSSENVPLASTGPEAIAVVGEYSNAFPTYLKISTDVGKIRSEHEDNDPLLKRLKDIDKNNDGVFSTAEIMSVCHELMREEAARKRSNLIGRKLAAISGMLGFLLIICALSSLCSTLWAISISKETDVPDTSGIMLTRGKSSDRPPEPVATAAVKETVDGLSGLKESTKEELDRLDEVSFFHDGGYHKMKVSQVHRYDGRVEVWGLPAGILVVQDSGEVFYAPFGVPSVKFDACFGDDTPDAKSAECGYSLDNEPPSNLEVENPKDMDPENAPSPARRLSLSNSTADSSRRRSGRSESSRRRTFGTYSSYSVAVATADSRRRAQNVSFNLDAVNLSSDSGGRRRVVQKPDGVSRRRYPNYYEPPSRTQLGTVHVVSTGLSSNTTDDAHTQQYHASGSPAAGDQGVDACASNMEKECEDDGLGGQKCWCNSDSSNPVQIWVFLVVGGGLCLCCSLATVFLRDYDVKISYVVTGSRQ